MGHHVDNQAFYKSLDGGPGGGTWSGKANPYSDECPCW